MVESLRLRRIDMRVGTQATGVLARVVQGGGARGRRGPGGREGRRAPAPAARRVVVQVEEVVGTVRRWRHLGRKLISLFINFLINSGLAARPTGSIPGGA